MDSVVWSNLEDIKVIGKVCPPSSTKYIYHDEYENTSENKT